MTPEPPRPQPPPGPGPVPLWRWRRNALRRGSDRLHAWIGLTLTLAVLAAAPATMLLVGNAVYDRLHATAREQALARHRTTATLTQDVPGHPEPGSDEAALTRYPATVRYAGPGGDTRTAEADVPPGLPAGSRVRVWTDDRGRLTEPPTTDEQVQSRTMGWALAAGVAVVGVAVVAHVTSGLALERRNLAEWERRWAETEPRWTRSA